VTDYLSPSGKSHLRECSFWLSQNWNVVKVERRKKEVEDGSLNSLGEFGFGNCVTLIPYC
jgi:hypothetical protein